MPGVEACKAGPALPYDLANASDGNGVTAAARLGRLFLALVATAASAIFAYAVMFSQFRYYDDEGDVMMSVKAFLDGRALYNEAFLQYGPFYYVVAKFFYTVTQAPVSHDITRLATIGLWLATAAAASAAVYKLTSSFGWSLVAGLQTVLHCRAVSNEPGHPQAILIALTMTAPLIAATLPPQSAAVALGALVACMTLTKVNIGAYTAGALFLVVLGLTRRRALITAAFIAASAAAVGAPFVVTRGADWALNYAWIAALSIAACCVTLVRADVRDRLHAKAVGWFIAAGVVTGILILSIAALVGTSSIVAMFHSSVIVAAQLPNMASAPWRLPSSGVVLGELSLAAAVVVAFIPPAWKASLGIVLKAAFGVAIAVAMTRSRDAMMSIAPWLWVILLPPRSGWWPLEAGFPRAVIGLMAACHLLIGYPMAGSQQSWSTMLLIPAAIVSLADASSVLTSRLTVPMRRVAEPIMLALVIYFYYPRLDTLDSLRRYQALTPLSLPGSDRIRLRDEEVRLYRDVSASLSQECSAFVSMPGLSSFHFWTRQDPPTGFVSGAWTILYDADTQQRIVDRLEAHDSPCVLYNRIINDEWAGGRNIEGGPLVHYIRSSFTTVRTIGDFELLKRKR